MASGGILQISLGEVYILIIEYMESEISQRNCSELSLLRRRMSPVNSTLFVDQSIIVINYKLDSVKFSHVDIYSNDIKLDIFKFLSAIWSLLLTLKNSKKLANMFIFDKKKRQSYNVEYLHLFFSFSKFNIKFTLYQNK